MRYIATREGVEKLAGNSAVTKGQRELIQKLLHDFPDAVELFEYEDYCRTPTLGTASAFISMALDAMLHAKQISSPTGKAKWTRAAVDHLLSNGKYIAVIGMEKFMDAQFEKSARCNVDYDKEGTPRKGTRYVSPAVIQI